MRSINQEPPRVFVTALATLAARVITILDQVQGRASRLEEVARVMERHPSHLYNHIRYPIAMGGILELKAPDGGIVLALKDGVTVEVDDELQLVSVGERSDLVGPVVQNWVPVGAPAAPIVTNAPRSVFELGCRRA